MNIKISIIIPCYNVEKWLIDRAIKSVINQSFNNYEIIIVDDGSEKKYHNYLVFWKEKNHRIKLITVQNQGVSVARNIGIHEAKGEYVTFLDADDAFVPGFLNHAHSLVVKENPLLVIGGIKMTTKIDENIKLPDKINYKVLLDDDVKKLKKKLIGKHDLIKFGSSGCYIGRGSVCRFVKKDLAEKHLFKNNIRIGEDLIWNLELLSYCNKVLIVYEQWYWYWVNPLSATHKYNPYIYEELVNHLNEIDKLIDLKNPEIYGSYLEHIYEGIYLIWNCYLCKSNNKKSKIIIKKLYSEKPWILLFNKEIKKCKSKKIRIFAKMHKCHLLFAFLKFRKIIGK